MTVRLFIISILVFLFTSAAFGQTSWLDRPLRNWNTSNNVPAAPRATGDSPNSVSCRNTVRSPESIADRAVTRTGWFLFGPAQIYGAVTLVNGMTSVDGMCQPLQYNTFIFVGNRFAGTLSPDPMDSRTDGALTQANLIDPTNVSAEFARYTSRDALCCPSQMSMVSYNIAGLRVQAQNVETKLACETQGEAPPDANTVSGTVTYRTRLALPRDSVLTVKLVEIPIQNVAARVIAQQSTNLNGQQAPLSFSLKFNERDISFRNNYGVMAEISSGGRILFKNDSAVRVLTSGNPSRVEIIVVPASGSDQTNDGVLRGSVTYRQRIALANDSEIRLKLVDVSTDGGNIIAEDSFPTNGRQVPISFELRYDTRQINSRRAYVVRAEIFTGGRLAFKSERDFSVLTLGAPTSGIEIITIEAIDQELPVITGKDISISKFGTGSFSLEGRSDTFLIRGSVKVQPDGKAEVTISPLGTGISFSGNLTYADDTTLRITVKNSGNANASGEIEVSYSDRRLNSIKSTNLVVDGQQASINF